MMLRGRSQFCLILIKPTKVRDLGNSIRPCFRFASTSKGKELDPELKAYMHGRGNRERRDSVTNAILLERHKHMERIKRLPIYLSLLRDLEPGLGDRKRKHQVYAPTKSLMFGGGSAGNQDIKKTNSGAGGFAIHLTSATSDWPIFKHILPEIAFAGHSNSGKSTLVNAMIGVLPSKGPAKVSERAGWTDQICFYQLGKKPPVLTLADLPGYGHAVASAAQRRAWANMMRDYLQNRPVLSRCCILVDCTRGLCRQDKMLVRFLSQRDIPWMIVLTKGDLLDRDMLAQCVLAVQLDLAQFVKSKSAERELARARKRESYESGAGAGSDEDWEAGNDDVASDDEDESEVDQNEIADGELKEETGDLEEGNNNKEVEEEQSQNLEEKDSESESDSASESEEEEDTDIPNLDRVPVQVISSSTGAGIQRLWRLLCGFARQDAPMPRNAVTGSGAPSTTVVREHRLASVVRAKRGLTTPGRPDMKGKRGERFPVDNSSAKKRPPIRIGKNRRAVRAKAREATQREQ